MEDRIKIKVVLVLNDKYLDGFGNKWKKLKLLINRFLLNK